MVGFVNMDGTELDIAHVGITTTFYGWSPTLFFILDSLYLELLTI
jgi:hypothetical protein